MARPPIRSASAQRVRERIKALALDQIAAGGPPALSLNAVAAALGVSGPAMYRYYRNREALLTDLVVDAYRGLADAVAPAVTPADFASAYRRGVAAGHGRAAAVPGVRRAGTGARSRPRAARGMDAGPRRHSNPGPGGNGARDLGTPARAGSLEINCNVTSVGVDPGPLYADAVRSGPGSAEIP